jgi:hypothetical protein
MGVPLLLPVLKAGLDMREEGVSDRVDSSLRFFDGGAFFIVVAVPFFLGRGRFLEIVESARTSSVDGIGTEDSRSGDWCRALFSRLSELMALEGSMSLICNEERLASMEEEVCGTARASCFICAGDRSPVSSFEAFEGSTSDGTGACDVDDSAYALALKLSSASAGEPGNI